LSSVIVENKEKLKIKGFLQKRNNELDTQKNKQYISLDLK